MFLLGLKFGEPAKSTALPPDKNSGQRWIISPLPSRVSGCGVPPSWETCCRPCPTTPCSTRVPWLLQLAPPGTGALASVTAALPFTETFLSFPPAKKPIHWLSGEKNGLTALSVPAMGFASWLSIGRRKKLLAFGSHRPPGLSLGDR